MMILEELKEIESGRRERHQFGVVIGIALFLVGGLLLWRWGFYPALFVIGGLFVAPVAFDKVFGTDTAIILWPLQKVWMALALVLGLIISSLILAFFFFGVFTAVRVANRFVGKALLDTAWAPGSKESYWIARDDEDYEPERTEKQY